MWTTTLHSYGYASGYYSSAASGVRMLDDARVRTGNRIAMPDQVWIADWDGKASTYSSHIRSDGWQPYGRAKQYRGGHTESWGGVRINIDRNYLNLRTPRLPGSSAPTPAPTPPTTSTGPRYTGSSLADARCTSEVHQPHGLPPDERRTRQLRDPVAVPAQAAAPLPLRGHREVELADHRRPAGLPGPGRPPRRDIVTLNDWVSLVVAGNGGTVVRAGSKGADVTRVQRALNAAGSPYLTVTGSYNTATANAIGAYQRKSASAPRRWWRRRPGRRCGPAGAEGRCDRSRAQARCSAETTLVKKPRPSVPGPHRSSTACSGCGISPTTLPASLVIPAIARCEPLGFSR